MNSKMEKSSQNSTTKSESSSLEADIFVEPSELPSMDPVSGAMRAFYLEKKEYSREKVDEILTEEGYDVEAVRSKMADILTGKWLEE